MTQQSLYQTFRYFGVQKQLTVQPVLCFGTNIKLLSYRNLKTLSTHRQTLWRVFSEIPASPPPTPHVFILEYSDTREQCYMTF